MNQKCSWSHFTITFLNLFLSKGKREIKIHRVRFNHQVKEMKSEQLLHNFIISWRGMCQHGLSLATVCQWGMKFPLCVLRWKIDINIRQQAIEFSLVTGAPHVHNHFPWCTALSKLFEFSLTAFFAKFVKISSVCPCISLFVSKLTQQLIRHQTSNSDWYFWLLWLNLKDRIKGKRKRRVVGCPALSHKKLCNRPKKTGKCN